MDPLVSIIAVNYNTPGDTLEFIRSCEKLAYSNFEIIVVDNASNPPLPEIQGKNLKIIHSRTNAGFAGGNNIGVDAAKGKYIFFLNSDTLVPETLLTDVVSFLEQTPDAGAVSPKILYADGKTIQFAGSGSISTYTGRGKRIGRYEQDEGQRDDIRKTELVHGAAFIVPRAVIDRVGKMSEAFFLYYEEHDWAEQIKRAGYTLYYFGKSHILHKESKSVGKQSPLKTYYMTRNRILFLRRNASGLALALSMGFIIFVTFPVNLLRYLIKGKFALLSAYWKGFFWHAKNLSLANAAVHERYK